MKATYRDSRNLMINNKSTVCFNLQDGISTNTTEFPPSGQTGVPQPGTKKSKIHKNH